ncbi:MAG TPA: YncE family protein [Mycobacterium sp.]
MDLITFTYNPIGDIAADAAGTTLVLTHPRESALSILDVDDPAGASLIRLDSDPVAVTVAGGRAFVATTSPSYDAVYVIDLESRILVSAHPLAFNVASVAASSDGARVFAARTGRLGNDVAVVDIATGAVQPVEIPSDAAAIVDVVRASDSGALYAGISTARDGLLAVIDTTGGRIVATVPVGAPIRDVAVSPDSSLVYVLAHHPRGAAAVIRYDIASNAIGAAVRVGDFATQVAVSPDGAWVYVLEPWGLAMISATTDDVVNHIAVGGWPSCIVSPAADRLYVANYAGVLTGLPAVDPAPSLDEALQSLIADPAAQLQPAAV